MKGSSRFDSVRHKPLISIVLDLRGFTGFRGLLLFGDLSLAWQSNSCTKTAPEPDRSGSLCCCFVRDSNIP